MAERVDTRTTEPDPSKGRARKRAANGSRRSAGPDNRSPVDVVVHPEQHAPSERADLTQAERRLLGDLFAIIEEHAADSVVLIDRDQVEGAFVYSCQKHA